MSFLSRLYQGYHLLTYDHSNKTHYPVKEPIAREPAGKGQEHPPQLSYYLGELNASEAFVAGQDTATAAAAVSGNKEAAMKAYIQAWDGSFKETARKDPLE